MTDKERVKEYRKQFMNRQEIRRKTGLSMKQIANLIEEIEAERQEKFLKETGKMYDPKECMELYQKFYEAGQANKRDKRDKREKNAITQTARYLLLPEREVSALIRNREPIFRVNVNLPRNDINDVRNQFSFLKQGAKIGMKQSYTDKNGFHTRVLSAVILGMYEFGILVLIERKRREFFSFSGLYADKWKIELVEECRKKVS